MRLVCELVGDCVVDVDFNVDGDCEFDGDAIVSVIGF